MKKIILTILTIVIIIVTIICVKYSLYKTKYNIILKENAEFDQYTNEEIYGIELGTLINKCIDRNTKNKIVKDDKGIFIENKQNSIKIDIYMQDNEQVYQMEAIYNGGIEKFIQHYGDIKFKCSKIEYHESTHKIKYLLFEQIVSS